MLDMGYRSKLAHLQSGSSHKTLVSFLFCETIVNSLTEMHSGYIVSLSRLVT